jgi:hypothetical protein
VSWPILHWSCPDLSKAEGSEEQRRQVHRQVRDGIQKRIQRELLSEAVGG